MIWYFFRFDIKQVHESRFRRRKGQNFDQEKFLKEFSITCWIWFENVIKNFEEKETALLVQITCQIEILVHFQIIRKCNFGRFRRDKMLRVDHNYIFGPNSTREIESLETLFWTKIWNLAYFSLRISMSWKDYKSRPTLDHSVGVEHWEIDEASFENFALNYTHNESTVDRI